MYIFSAEPCLMPLIMKENAVFFVDNLRIDDMLLASLLQSDILTPSDQELVEVRTSSVMKSMI